ncbi:hypothetical protein NJ76_20095 [Rhodococcus sp. IITR03]|nr:hypothetical protein NJ76_20095 [Rhodococcus sp. IITR03]
MYLKNNDFSSLSSPSSLNSENVRISAKLASLSRSIEQQSPTISPNHSEIVAPRVAIAAS